MIIKQNSDKTITKAKFKAELKNPVTQSKIGKCDFQLQLSLPKGYKLELNQADNLIKISNKTLSLDEESIKQADL